MTQLRTQRSPEPAGAFGGFIGPRNLVSQVASTLPWLLDRELAEQPGDESAAAPLADLASGPLGWRRILAAAARLAASEDPTPAQRTDYFALCLAAHFASAASFVPTDVDT